MNKKLTADLPVGRQGTAKLIADLPVGRQGTAKKYEFYLLCGPLRLLSALRV